MLVQYRPVLLTIYTGIATEATAAQPACALEAGEEIELLCRQLFQRDYASWSLENRESTKNSSGTQADSTVRTIFILSSMIAYDSFSARQDFQFFPPRLAELQEQELAAHKVRIFVHDYTHTSLSLQRLNEIPATLREPAGPEDTPDILEAERQAAQEFIDNGMCTILHRTGI